MASGEMFDSLGSQGLQRIVQFRVKRGADLLAAITEAAKQEKIKAGVIVSGLGALDKAVFRNLRRWPASFPVQDKERIYLKIESPLELVSLTGWIAAKDAGQPEIHAHFAASTVEGETVRTYGGHLTPGTVAGIKTVVALAVVEEGSMQAVIEEETKTLDVVFKPDRRG